jgi:hypothetical protein
VTEGDTELGGGRGRGHRATSKPQRALSCNGIVTVRLIFDFRAATPWIFPIGF